MKKYLIVVFLGVLLGSPTFAAEFENNLRFGIKHRDVTKLQEYLADEGLYTGPITGNFFSLTLKAVKAFQTREGISPASGYVGPVTRNRLNDIFTAQLAESNAEVGGVETVVEPKTTDDVVISLEQQRLAMEEQNRLLVEQLSRQARQNELLQQQITQQQDSIIHIQEQSRVLETIKQNTTQPAVPEIVNSPAQLPLLPPYSSSEMAAKSLFPRLTPEPEFNRFDVVRPRSNVRVFFEGQELQFGDSNYLKVENLERGITYNYRWVVQEEGREDSVFEGVAGKL